MRWMRVLGVLAVVDVVCLALGAAISLGSGVLASASAVPAVASAALVVAGVVVAVLAAGPEANWTANPYW